MKRSVFALALSMGIFTMHAQMIVPLLKAHVRVTTGLLNWKPVPWLLLPTVRSSKCPSGFRSRDRKTTYSHFGLGIQGMGYVNTTASKTAFDASEVSVFGKVNLMNLFGSYTGEPRIFEIEALTGIGWLHYYQNGPGDTNSWSTRLGLNLNLTWVKRKHGRSASNRQLYTICREILIEKKSFQRQ